MTHTFTSEQLEALAPYEERFREAATGWCRRIVPSDVETILGVWNAATGQDRKVNLGCRRCILNLLSDTGTLYFAQTAALRAEKAATSDEKPAEVAKPHPAPKKAATAKKPAKTAKR